MSDLPIPPDTKQVDEWTYLPPCPDALRLAPNLLLRSALFGAIAKGKRRWIKDEHIVAVDGVTIRCTGESFDQGDQDVWQSIIYAAQDKKLGSHCKITASRLLQLMGMSINGKNREILTQRIKRLVSNSLTITTERYSYFGSLIYDAYKDEKTHEWVIQINPKMLPFFAADQYTLIDWNVRQDLNGKPLAQWLHGFYSTHARPYPYRVETLLKMSGCQNTGSRSRKQKLIKALDQVQQVSARHGKQFIYMINNDIVHVRQSGSDSQQRHISRAEASPP